MSNSHSEGNAVTSGKGNDNHPFAIIVVVGGDDQKLQVKPNEIAKKVLEAALKKAKNAGQPIDDWELKTEAGVALNLAATLAQLNIGKDETLFASLKVGAAG